MRPPDRRELACKFDERRRARVSPTLPDGAGAAPAPAGFVALPRFTGNGIITSAPFMRKRR